MQLRPDSTEYVSGTLVTDHDVTGSNVDVVFLVTGVAPDVDTTWLPAEVISVTEETTDRWVTEYRILVGPEGGDATLATGVYDFLVRLTDTPEVPIRIAGQIEVSTDGC